MKLTKRQSEIVTMFMRSRDFVIAREIAGGFTLEYRGLLRKAGISERTERRYLLAATRKAKSDT